MPFAGHFAIRNFGGARKGLRPSPSHFLPMFLLAFNAQLRLGEALGWDLHASGEERSGKCWRKISTGSKSVRSLSTKKGKAFFLWEGFKLNPLSFMVFKHKTSLAGRGKEPCLHLNPFWSLPLANWSSFSSFLPLKHARQWQSTSNKTISFKTALWSVVSQKWTFLFAVSLPLYWGPRKVRTTGLPACRIRQLMSLHN